MCDVCGSVPEWLSEPAEVRGVEKRKKKKRPKEAPAVSPVSAPLPPPHAKTVHAPLRPPAPAAGRPATPVPPAPPPAAAAGPDPALLEFFKQWRRHAAERASVPAYIVLSDAALVDLCRKRPSNLRELLGVTGIGERKAELYGSEIFAAFEAFHNGSRARPLAEQPLSPTEQTIQLVREGKSFEEIAQIRGRQLSIVVNTVSDLVEKGRIAYRPEWVGADAQARIEEAIRAHGSQWLKPLREALPAEISSEQIRLVVAYVRSREQRAGVLSPAEAE